MAVAGTGLYNHVLARGGPSANQRYNIVLYQAYAVNHGYPPFLIMQHHTVDYFITFHPVNIEVFYMYYNQNCIF